MPSEHGGWGLTLEPVLLGLLVAPSVAGVLLGVAAFLAFLVRTPLKLALVDLRRDRWLARTRLATTVAAVELAMIAILATLATAVAGPRWWTAVAIAVPFVAVELSFDMRSRGRRLVPELCGAIAVCAVVAAITLAAGEGAAMAAALWVLLAARAVAAIPFVRTQIMRLRGVADGPVDLHSADLAQVAAIVLGAFAVALVGSTTAGFVALIAIAALHLAWLRRPPAPAKVLGMRQMALGLALVLVTAAGVALA